MKKVQLPVVWEMSGYVEVEADSVEAAMDYFNKNSDHISLPANAEYVCGSFGLACDDPESIRICDDNNTKNIDKYIKNKGVFVGCFSEKEIDAGADKIAIEAAREKTGLQYTNMEIDYKRKVIKVYVCTAEDFKI